MKALFTKIGLTAMMAGAFTANAQWQDVSYSGFAGSKTQVITHSGKVFVSNGYSLYRSNDMGNTWTPLSVYNGYFFTIIHTSAALIAGGGSSNADDTDVYVSHDDGNTWAANKSISGAGAYTINVFSALGSEVMAGLGGSITSDAFRTSDDGANWNSCGPSSVHEIRSFASDSYHIYAGTQYNAVYQYTNVSGSAVWVHLDTAGFPSYSGLFDNVSALCVVNGKVWAAAGPGVYELDTVLHKWTPITIESYSTTCLLVAGSTVIRGTYGNGIFVSRDTGATWYQDNTGLVDYNISSLAYSGDTVFAGSYGNKVYRSMLSALTAVAPLRTPVATCTISPNPASSVLHITSPDKITVDVFRIDGKLMAHETNNNEINISSFPAGLYIAKILKTDGGVEVQKFEKL